MRTYSSGKPQNLYRKERAKPSKYKLSLCSTLPTEIRHKLSGKVALIFCNENCDIIFKMEDKSCYYNDISNKHLEEFEIVHQ